MRTVLWITAVIAAVTLANADEVGNKNRKANKLYNSGKYAEALKLYDDAIMLDPADGKLKMNRGSTLYRLNELDEAEKSYLDALSSQINKKTTADAHYNLGNVQYKQGEALEAKGDASSAKKKYTGALDNYINTLKLRPSDMDAKWNLQMAHQKIELMKEQEQQQQEQQQQEGEDQDNKDGKDDKDKQGGKDDKDQDSKDKDDQQDKDNKDQDDKDQQQQDDKDQQDKDQQDKDQQQDKSEEDAKREEAERLIEQYADDADTLNKPRFQRGRVRQPEKDW